MPRVLKISDAMRAMHSQTFECWKELLGPNRYHDLIRPLGQVHVWETEQETPGAVLERSLRERQGIPSERLTADDLRQLFPGISRRSREACSSPATASRSIRSAWCRPWPSCSGRGRHDHLRARHENHPARGGGYTVMTNTGWHPSKELVVAAGAWSPQLLDPLGIRLPLETERGYHAMLTSPASS